MVPARHLLNHKGEIEMKYLLLTVLCFIATGCIQDLNRYQPDHISITPSVEWEIQRG